MFRRGQVGCKTALAPPARRRTCLPAGSVLLLVRQLEGCVVAGVHRRGRQRRGLAIVERRLLWREVRLRRGGTAAVVGA